MKNPISLVAGIAATFSGSLAAQGTVEGTGTFLSSTPGGTTTVTYNLANPGTSNVLVVGVYNDNTAIPASITFDGNPADGYTEASRTLVACYFDPDESVNITVNVAVAATNTGIFVYELSGIDTAGAVNTGTGTSMTTTDDSMFVVNFGGVNFGTGAGTVPTAGSIIPSANSGVFDINGGTGGGALAHGYGVAGFAGTQPLGWAFNNGSNLGEVSLALTTGANPDSDGDGLLDTWEMANFGDLDEIGTGNPDGDSANNEAEETAGSDPNNVNSVPGDIDGDSFADADELLYFGNLLQTPSGDFDGDYASNLQEVTAGTNPSNAGVWPDTDADLMADGWEAAHGLTVGTNDSGLDGDSDGATNLEEFQAGTDPGNGTWWPGNAVLAHRWTFDGTLADSVGGSTAVIENDDPLNLGFSSDTMLGTGVELYGGPKGTSDYINLGSNLLSNLQTGGVQPVTIELWASQEFVQNWSRIFSFGVNDGNNPVANESLRMTWSQGTDINTDQVAWEPAANWGPGNAPYAEGVTYHIVMSIVPAVFSEGALASGARVTWYSAPAADSQAEGHPLYGAKGTLDSTSDLRSLLDEACTLGRSMYPDNTAAAIYQEVRIWKGALSETERELFQLLGPDDMDRSDADDDGFPDAWENSRFGNTTTAAFGSDADSDLDFDEDEFYGESNPDDVLSTLFDSDKDNLDDLWEMQYFNNLLWIGSDDPDGDFVDNETEEVNGTDPNDINSSPDLDGDGISDGWENFYFGDTATANATSNFDGDLDSDFEEFLAGTDPTDELSGRDADNDLLPDYWEFLYYEASEGDPGYLIFNGTNDTDVDGATNADEFADGTDPTDGNDFRDSNGDGIFDGISLAATDGFGTSSFNAGTNWTSGLAPVAGKNYLVPSGLRLRTPDTGIDATFAGANLVIAGDLALKGDNHVFTANYTFSDNFGIPSISQIVSAGGAVSLAGTINFQTETNIVAQNADVILAGIVSGSNPLNLFGPNAIHFTNVSNTFNGDILLGSTASLVIDGTLTTGAGSVFEIVPVNGTTSNSITGSGTLNLAGTLDIDVTATSPANGALWSIVPVGSATVNYDPGFTVTGSGFAITTAGAVGERVWTDSSGDYEFDEFTGLLSFVGEIVGYAGWAGDFGLTTGVNDGILDNPDGDAFGNLLEYQLGGDPLAGGEELVTTTINGTNAILGFDRYDLSESDATLVFRWSTDLVNWNEVTIGAASSGPNANGVMVTITEDGGATADYDAVTVTLPRSNAANGKLFWQFVGTQL